MDYRNKLIKLNEEEIRAQTLMLFRDEFSVPLSAFLSLSLPPFIWQMSKLRCFLRRLNKINREAYGQGCITCKAIKKSSKQIRNSKNLMTLFFGCETTCYIGSRIFNQMIDLQTKARRLGRRYFPVWLAWLSTFSLGFCLKGSDTIKEWENHSISTS